ncbi:MAG: hypothetical protein RLO52_14390 [Sandaracinaceae bacterium]|jgi:hypothetical protein|nr:MAG: hypothetical protein EVA89_06635 [Sandaracinaceae bacterium]HBQ19067.1 hypothetical protein [Myxococcales bacterium]
MSDIKDVLDGDEVREVLSGTFYRDAAAPSVVKAPRTRSRKKKEEEKPDHYQVICISLYTEDLERLDQKVKLLKDSGHRKMSRSALIRYALDTADLDGLPRPY